jgi:hypothetical protein
VDFNIALQNDIASTGNAGRAVDFNIRCETIYHAPVTQVPQGGLCILKSVVLPVSPVSPVHDILCGSCILKSVVLPVSPVSPVHDILFGSCILKSVV